MRYYKLDISIDKKVIGRYPQSTGGIWNGVKHEVGKDFVDLAKYGPVHSKFPMFDPILHKSAIATDMLSGDSHLSLAINNRFYSFLKPLLNNIPHQIWDYKVYNSEAKTNFESNKLIIKNKDKLKVYDYKLFHISYPKLDFIDYSKSLFQTIVYDDKSNEVLIEDDIVVKNREERIKLARKYMDDAKENNLGRKKLRLKTKKICINTKNIQEDMFRVADTLNCGSFYTSGYYVSEKLKNEIEKQGFTGLEFLSLNKLNDDNKIEIV